MQGRSTQAFGWALHYEAEGGQAGDDYRQAGYHVGVGEGGGLLLEQRCGAGVGLVGGVGGA